MRPPSLLGESVETEVWVTTEGRFVGYGDDIAKLGEIFAPFHPELGVHPLTLPESLTTLLTRRNPFRASKSEWWKSARDQRLRSNRIDLDPFSKKHLEHRSAYRDDATFRLMDRTELASARAMVRGLAGRVFPLHSVAVPFQLDALTDARLLTASRSEHDALHIVGDIGGGWLLELRVQRFEDEPPREEVTVDGNHLDGGDFRAWMYWTRHERLGRSPREVVPLPNLETE